MGPGPGMPASASSGGGPAIRGFTQGTMTSGSSSLTVSLPVGSASGDYAVIQIGSAYGISGVCSGVACANSWTYLDSNPRSCISGNDFYRTLTSGDVSTGTVTTTASGAYGGGIALTVFVGTHSAQSSYNQYIAGGLNTTSWPVSGAAVTTTGATVGLWFFVTRQSGTPTLLSSLGTQQGTQTDNSGVGTVSYAQAIPSSTIITPTFSSSNLSDGGCGGSSWAVDEVVVQ